MSLMLKPSGEIVEEHILYRMDPDKLNMIAASVFIVSDVMALTGAILGWTFLLFIALAVFAASACLAFLSWRSKRGQTKFSGRYVILDEYEDYVRLFEQYNSNSTPTSGLKHVRNAWLGGLQLCATYMSDLSSLQREEARFSESFEDARRTVAKTYAELFSDFKHYETVFGLTRGQNLSKNAALLQATDVMIKEVLACGELTSQASRLFVESRMPDTHEDILTRELTAVQQRLDALSEIHPKTPMIGWSCSGHKERPPEDQEDRS
jgi:biopolymer transport protein ExbB/TolQ